jgi:CheY-like chemotaxis protein
MSEMPIGDLIDITEPPQDVARVGDEMKNGTVRHAIGTTNSAPARNRLAHVRVLLVDDDPTELERLSVALSDEEMTVVGTTDSGEHALDLARILGPDVAVIRWSLRHFGGGLTARLMRRHAPSVIPLLLLDVKDLDEVHDLTRGMGFVSVMRHAGDAEMRRMLRSIGGLQVALEAPGDGRPIAETSASRQPSDRANHGPSSAGRQEAAADAFQ